MAVECVCKQCGKKFYRRKSRAGNFCSAECRDTARKTGEKVKCHTCGTEFYRKRSQLDKGKGKYCSRKCAQKRVVKKCEACGTLYIVQAWYKHSRFCSMSCAKKGERSSLYKHGLSMTAAYRTHQSQKRRSLVINAAGSFTLGEWELLKKQYGNKCPICKREEPEIKLTIDHIIPLSKGGSNYIENIQPLCRTCNISKATKAFKVSPLGQVQFLFIGDK